MVLHAIQTGSNPRFRNAIFGKHGMYSLFRKIFLITRKYGYLKIKVAKLRGDVTLPVFSAWSIYQAWSISSPPALLLLVVILPATDNSFLLFALEDGLGNECGLGLFGIGVDF